MDDIAVTVTKQHVVVIVNLMCVQILDNRWSQRGCHVFKVEHMNMYMTWIASISASVLSIISTTIVVT